jgi:hypothetical protein
MARETMTELDKRPVILEALLVSRLAQTDALVKLLIEKGLITQDEFMRKLSEETGDVSKTLCTHNTIAPSK